MRLKVRGDFFQPQNEPKSLNFLLGTYFDIQQNDFRQSERYFHSRHKAPENKLEVQNP